MPESIEEFLKQTLAQSAEDDPFVLAREAFETAAEMEKLADEAWPTSTFESELTKAARMQLTMTMMAMTMIKRHPSKEKYYHASCAPQETCERCGKTIEPQGGLRTLSLPSFVAPANEPSHPHVDMGSLEAVRCSNESVSHMRNTVQLADYGGPGVHMLTLDCKNPVKVRLETDG